MAKKKEKMFIPGGFQGTDVDTVNEENISGNYGTDRQGHTAILGTTERLDSRIHREDATRPEIIRHCLGDQGSRE